MGVNGIINVGRWPIIVSHRVRPIVVAVADPSPSARECFEDAGVVKVTNDYRNLLADQEIDVLYIAVPHHLHERIYLDAIDAVDSSSVLQESQAKCRFSPEPREPSNMCRRVINWKRQREFCNEIGVMGDVGTQHPYTPC